MAASKTIQDWKADLSVVSRNVEEAIKQFFIEQGMQRAARRDLMVLQALNHNARFWTVASHSMTVGVYMALRRIMDQDGDASSMQRVIQFVVQSPEQFDDLLRTALKRRELPDDDAHVNRERRRLGAAMKRIGRTFRKIDREWKKNYKDCDLHVRAQHPLETKARRIRKTQTSAGWTERCASCRHLSTNSEI